MVSLKLYGDESADASRKRVFAVAAVIGTETEWQLAIRPWLRRTKGLPIHTTDLETRSAADPDPQKHKDALALYKDLTQILCESYLAGVAVALDLKAHKELFPQTLPELPYIKCSSDVVGVCGEMAKRYNANEPEPLRLEPIFDSRLETDGSAAMLYSILRQHPEWAHSDVFGSRIVFETGDDPRLEIADLLVREAMKELDRKVTQSSRDVRRSRIALERTGKFKFVERDRAYCERWLAAIEAPQSQAERQEYARWLQATGRVQNGVPHDTLANRALFAVLLDKRDAATS